jgi:hypothetical protein
MSEKWCLTYPLRIISHSRTVRDIGQGSGWLPGARYTNLRDVRSCDKIGLIDIDWREYDFERHLAVVKKHRPLMTVAKDIISRREVERVLQQAAVLSRYSAIVIVVPKTRAALLAVRRALDKRFILGYSVPTSYGGTSIPACHFRGIPVHLLGGRPDVQREIASQLDVLSVDGNRFTLDAKYGDYFDGGAFRPHPKGGYERCIADSIQRINKIWHDYTYSPPPCIQKRIEKWLERQTKGAQRPQKTPTR